MDFLGAIKATKISRDETNIMDFLGIVKATKADRDKAIKDAAKAAKAAADAADAANDAENIYHYICRNAVFNKMDEFEKLQMYNKDVRDAMLADLRRPGDPRSRT